MERCEQCGTKIRGRAFTGPLGGSRCASCHDRFVGTLVAMTSGEPGAAHAMAGTDATRPNGILAWIRRALRR